MSAAESPQVPKLAARARNRARVRVWREQHAFCFAASCRQLARHPFGTALTVLVMGLALALPLVFMLLLGNVQRLSSAMGESQAISVFLRPAAKADTAQTLASQWRARPDVSAVVVKTPRQGLAELAAVQGFGDALRALPDNPLPWVLVVQPRQNLQRADADALVAALRHADAVGLVQDNGQWRARLDAYVALGRRITWGLAALLALAALLVVGNTVRLDIRSRAQEIAVQRLVGAGAAFVRRPYLYEGVWFGALAGLVAVALVLALEWSLAAPVHALVTSYDGRLELAGLSAAMLTLVPLAAALLGWIGAWIASTRHLLSTHST